MCVESITDPTSTTHRFSTTSPLFTQDSGRTNITDNVGAITTTTVTTRNLTATHSMLPNAKNGK